MAADSGVVKMFIVCLLLKAYTATDGVTTSGVNRVHVYNASGADVASHVQFISYNTTTHATGEFNEEANFSSSDVEEDSSGANINNTTTNIGDKNNPVADSDVQFRLFTRYHPVLAEDTSLTVEGSQEAVVELDKTEEAVVELDKTGSTNQVAVVDWLDNFSTGKKIVVITHGFRGSGDGEMCTQLRDAFLSTSDVNVFVVDWKKLARMSGMSSYKKAVTHTRHVAERVARLLDHIVDQSASTLADVHLVGFSLGAHVMGQAGRLMRTPGKVARITGLDPAKPLFEKKPLSERLDAGDARFVDVVHAETSSFGFKRRLGHVDIYPNGGEPSQPACANDTAPVLCDHRMSWRYYAAAVYQPRLCVAQRCDSWEEYVNATADNTTCPWSERALLGPQLDPSTRGMYFLRTLSVSPYCVTGVQVNSTAQNTTWRSWTIDHASLDRLNNTAYNSDNTAHSSGNTAHNSGNTAHDNSGNTASSSATKNSNDVYVPLLIAHLICMYVLYRRFCCDAPVDVATVVLVSCGIALDVYCYYVMQDSNEEQVAQSTRGTERERGYSLEFNHTTLV